MDENNGILTLLFRTALECIIEDVEQHIWAEIDDAEVTGGDKRHKKCR